MTTGSASGAVERWLLSSAERGNAATGLAAWTTGNEVRVLAHGRPYFAELAEVLEGTGEGDLVLLAGWRVDEERSLTDEGLTLGEALRRAVHRGALVRGLVWRSHPSWLAGTLRENRRLVEAVNEVGGELLLDHRVRALGSHHQKFVVVRHRRESRRDVAFVGGLDLARGRRDDAAHRGDQQRRAFASSYGPRPAWHDVQLELRGPVVGEVEQTFRERWADQSPLSRLPWQRIPDRARGLPQRAEPLPPPLAPPSKSGTCAVQLMRTYPRRRPGYPFAPRGERSVARGFAKALDRAHRLVYVEDQYLWSAEVADLFARALRANPRLQVVSVAPRAPDQEGLLNVPPHLFGQSVARRVVQDAGRGRVHRFDIENDDGWPIYVHAKVTVVDDEWAAVGSSNLNRRSWTHDSELTAAVVDELRDTRDHAAAAGHGDGARRFARDLRLQLMCEHLGRAADDVTDLIDPEAAVGALRASADAFDAWYRSDRATPRPPGRLRNHVPAPDSPWRRRLASSVYDRVLDPDGRPLRTRSGRTG